MLNLNPQTQNFEIKTKNNDNKYATKINLSSYIKNIKSIAPCHETTFLNQELWQI